MQDALRNRLEGRLVALEPLEQRHEEGLWEAARDPAVWRWMAFDASTDRAAFAGWLADALAEPGRVPFAVLRRRSGAPVGSTSYLTLQPEHRGLEIGYTWYAREAWGTGVNVEAKLLLMEQAFERLGLWRVEFKTDSRNERSRAALSALPAQFEGIFRKHRVVRGGDRRDSAYYSVIDDEWPAVKANLERRLAERP